MTYKSKAPLASVVPHGLYANTPKVLRGDLVTETEEASTDTILKPIAWHDLDDAIIQFKNKFVVPEWAPVYDINDHHVEDIGHFINRKGNQIRTIALVVCDDDLLVTEWTRNSTYLLVAKPTPRSLVTVKKTREPHIFILYLEDPKTFFVLEASSGLEASEWVQKLTYDPDAVVRQYPALPRPGKVRRRPRSANTNSIMADMNPRQWEDLNTGLYLVMSAMVFVPHPLARPVSHCCPTRTLT